MSRPVQIITKSRRTAAWPRLAALPALLAGLLTLAVTVALYLKPDASEYVARYEHLAVSALSRGDYATAKVCFERLLQIRPQDARFREGLAISQSLHQRPDRGAD